MQKVLAHLLIVLLPALCYSQPNEQDELVFESAVEWLNRKLNYIYHDGTAQKWWVNSFFVNDQKEVTFKNVYTSNPRSVTIHEKVYHARIFKMSDINPYQISIRDIPKNQGRIVKGKLLELKTVDLEKNIRHTINERTGTPVSFVQISFPTIMIDSISDYAEIVKNKFQEAIIAATKVYATNNFIQNKQRMIKIMTGSFMSEDGMEMESSKRFDNVLSISITDSENYLVFNPSDNLFYLTNISNNGVSFETFSMVENEKILLQNTKNPDDIISIETENSFMFRGKLFYKK